MEQEMLGLDCKWLEVIQRQKRKKGFPVTEDEILLYTIKDYFILGITFLRDLSRVLIIISPFLLISPNASSVFPT